MESHLEVEKREDYESRISHAFYILGQNLRSMPCLFIQKNIFGKFYDELGRIKQFIKQKIVEMGLEMSIKYLVVIMLKINSLLI